MGQAPSRPPVWERIRERAETETGRFRDLLDELADELEAEDRERRAARRRRLEALEIELRAFLIKMS